MSGQTHIFVITTTLLVAICTTPMPADAKFETIRIGAYVRSGFEACMERWTPMATKLEQDIPGHRFVIVPLASREDIFHSLKEKKIDFLIANPAIYVCVEERFGASALCGMTSKSDPSGRDSTGCLIRKSDRNDLQKIEDLQDSQLSAVKPWSFTGWITQWQTLKQHHVDPLQDMPPISYEGTHEEVIQAVLNGTADVGAVANDILQRQIEAGKIDPNSLWVFDTKGDAVPVKNGIAEASTTAYPDWVFVKAAKTQDSLAEQVQKSLLAFDRDLQSREDNIAFAWTIPQNYQSVRETLRNLIGPDYAYVETFEASRLSLPGLVDAIIIALSFILTIVFLVAWRHARSRENHVQQEMETIRAELNEVRASKHLIETILTKVQCGMDIINESGEIVYATPGIEHRYGPWRGKRCHEYYWGASSPCKHCTKRSAQEHRKNADPYSGSCHVTLQKDTHPIGDPSEEESQGKLLQVSFYDKNGRWLYARVHLPQEQTLVKLKTNGMPTIDKSATDTNM